MNVEAANKSQAVRRRPPEGGQQRPMRQPVKSALITRSNNPLKQQEAKPIQATDEKKQPGDRKLPDYLAFLVDLLSYQLAFVCKVYSVTCFILSLPSKVIECAKVVALWPFQCLEKAAQVPGRLLLWCQNNIEGLALLCSQNHILAFVGLVVTFWFCPWPTMTYPLFALSRLILGTLYPAYASYKAVSTKNVREYVKWMMYWIVFALFSGVEAFTDIFIAFWFPFYYEVKIIFLIWLISPVSRGSLGSSILYRKFVHPTLQNREEEIDLMILKLQEQGYNTVTKLAVRAFNYVSDFVMQTAIRGGGGLVHQLRKSYSLTDLGNDESDFRDHRAITNDQDELIHLERIRRTGSTGRAGAPVRLVRTDPHESSGQIRRRPSSKSRESPRRDFDEFSSSGYSSSAINSDYYPVRTETMDTGDYELYDPRHHAKPRLVASRRPSKPKQEDHQQMAYPLSHSTSVASNAHQTSNWVPQYKPRSSSISSGSLYPTSDTDLEVEDVFEPAEEEVAFGKVTITNYSEDEGERTPTASKVVNIMDMQQYPIQERPPPVVAMARRPSFEERPVFKRPQPPRPASRAESGPRPSYYSFESQPARPASRASTSSSAFELEGQQRRAAVKAMLQQCDLPSRPPTSAEANKFGRCPHCKIHSWLPHSPNCPKKK